MAEKFDLEKIKALAENSKVEARQYLDKYFIPLTDGTHAMFNGVSYDILETPVLRSVYFKRMSVELNKYYFSEKLDIRKRIYDINKPVLPPGELNMCPQIKHKYVEYKTFDKDTKKNVEKMLKNIKEVWCSDKEDVFDFTKKWLANMIKGNKNNSCLYLKGVQGIGKTTPVDFIRHHVLGKELCVETGSGPLKTKFNTELAGKLLVSFEELENFNAAEWISISSVLKRIITSKTIMIEGKGANAFEIMNINNYILISNNDAITDDDGRRYFILPISLLYLGNTKYFNNLYAKCFNDKVGHAFYCYMMEVDTENFNPQAYPITSTKLDSIALRLDNTYKFLKEVYILKNKQIDDKKLTELHDEYLVYCKQCLFKALPKIKFNILLQNVGIVPKKHNGYDKFNISLETLKSIADKHHWVHELDEIEVDTTSDLDKSRVKKIYEKLLKEIAIDYGMEEEIKTKKPKKKVSLIKNLENHLL